MDASLLSQPTLEARALGLCLSHAATAILHHGADARFDFAVNLPPAWPTQSLLGRTIADIEPDTLAQRYTDAHRACAASGEPQSFAFDLPHAGQRRFFDIKLLQDADGVFVIVSDVTDRRAHDLAMKNLLREVSHRSKNLLAIVQSVAMQTANSATTTREFLDKFRGRLHALSSTQDLVTESDWRGTHLHTLIKAQTDRVGRALSRHLTVSGPDPLLGPNAALHVGLAIHELAANAMIHGALADEAPPALAIATQYLPGAASSPDLVFTWHETRHGAPSLPSTPRFGALVLERIVPLSVGGSAAYTLGPDSVVYRLQIPADQFEP